MSLLLAGNTASVYDAAHPRLDTLFYVLNADTGEANWATMDPELDQWTKQFLSGDTEGRTVADLFGGGESTKILTSSAPVAPLKPPELEFLGQEANGTTRTLRLHLASPRRAWKASLLPGPGVQILAVGERGKALQKGGDEPFTYSGLSPEGVDLMVKVRAAGPVRFTVVDQTNGLPRIPGVRLPSKPESVMSAPLVEGVPFAGYPAFVRELFAFQSRQAP